MKASILLCLLLVTGVCAQPDPEPKTYAAARAEADKWVAAGDFFKANPAIKKAYDLAKTNDEKVEATIRYVSRVVRYDSEEAGTKRYYKFNEAYQLYQDAMKGPSMSAPQIDELRLATADLVADAAKGSLVPPSFTDRIKTQTGKTLLEHARAEYSALIGAATSSASIKARAYIRRAKTRDTAITFGNIKKDEFVTAFNDLKAASELASAPDVDKANAYFEIVELATIISDANTVAGAYEATTRLTNATNDQKIKAYRGLIELMLGNNMIKASKDKVAEANKIVGLSAEQKAALYRLGALTIMTDVDPSDPAAVTKGRKLAIAELDKSILPRMSDEDKFKTYMAAGEYLQKAAVGTDLAVDQFEKAIKLPTIKDDRKAEAQYAVGETFRMHVRVPEARAAYQKVSNANSRYYNYAQQRIKELDAAKP